jgi:hypothetical protein
VSEYCVNVWSKSAPTILKPLRKTRQYQIMVEAEDAEEAVQAAFTTESTPLRLTGRRMPLVYAEVQEGPTITRCGDLGLKMGQ